MESRAHALETAQALVEMTAAIGMPLIYKSSFDKANRTSHNAPRGIGMDAALAIFAEIKARFGCPVITDVHESDQCAAVAEVVDVLRIPAFLGRQTDLLLAAAKTGAAVSREEGAVSGALGHGANVAAELKSTGNDRILLTERGASFGYNTLVSDMRAADPRGNRMSVVFDATHSVQQPGGQGTSSGGQREYVPVLARAAVAVGVAAVFIETHEIRTVRPATVRIWYRSTSCRRCSASCRLSTASRRRPKPSPARARPPRPRSPPPLPQAPQSRAVRRTR